MSDKKKVIRGLVAANQKIRSVQRFAQPNSPSGENVVITLESGDRITAWGGSKLHQQALRMRAGSEVDFTFRSMDEVSYTSGATGKEVAYHQFQGVEFLFEEQDVTLRGYIPGDGSMEDLPAALKDVEPIGFTQVRQRTVVAAPAADSASPVSDDTTKDF